MTAAPLSPTTSGQLAGQMTVEEAIAEGRCERCGNYPEVCGHHLPLAERMKTIWVDKSSLR